MIWLLHGGSRDLGVVRMSASDLGREFLLKRRMHEYQFYPATNPKIHVSHHMTLSKFGKYSDSGLQFMGRWTATPNRLRKDGTFPGEPDTLPL